jgi:PPP family 3-phenylpropionic acid transporter
LNDRSAAPTVVPFAALSFSYFAFAGLFSTYAPLWYQSLGYTTFAIGALTSMQSATRLFMPYAWGWVADHTGRREALLRIAVAGALLSSAGFFLVRGYVWVSAVTVALFLCTAGVIPISEAALAHRVSRGGQLDVSRYGRVRLWGSVGFVAVVTLSGFVLQKVGVGAFPLLASGLLVLLLLAALRVPASHETAVPTRQAGSALAVLREPLVAWFFAGVFLTVLAHTSLYAFYSLYLASLGFDTGTIGLLWGLGVLVEIAWFFFSGRWMHRSSLHGWLLVAALVSAVRFAAIAGLGAHLPVLIAAQLLHALTFAAQHSACIAVVSRHFPGRQRSRGQALYAVLGYGASGVIGGVAGGALSQAFGFAAVFWAAALASLGAAACCWRAMTIDRQARGRSAAEPGSAS